MCRICWTWCTSVSNVGIRSIKDFCYIMCYLTVEIVSKWKKSLYVCLYGVLYFKNIRNMESLVARVYHLKHFAVDNFLNFGNLI